MNAPMHTVDLMIIVLYLAAMLGIGLHFARKNKSTEDYYYGGRRFPAWAVGLSMLSNSISSITFLGLPAAAFVLDWRQSTPYLVLPVVITMAALFFVPIFRHGKITSAYQYLESRFGRAARAYGSCCFLISESIRLSTILYLLSLPISLMGGWNQFAVMGVIMAVVALYTVAGGINAVIWTDVIQAIILFGGGLFSVFFLLWKIPGDLDSVCKVGMEYHKFSFGPTTFDFAQRSFAALLIMGLFSWFYSYTADQSVIQRYLAAKSDRDAKRATILCAAASMPTWFTFYFIGTCLFVFFRFTGDPEVARLPADQVFPHFIRNYIPVGFSGLIVAGVLSAGMGALSSGLNAISSVITADVIRNILCPDREEAFYMRCARVGSFLIAAVMVGGAALLAVLPKESMVDLSFMIGGTLVMFGLSFFMLGFFFPRVGNRSIWLGFACGTAMNLYIVGSFYGWLPAAIRLPVHIYWGNVFCQVTMMTAAIAFSRLWPETVPPEKLEGFTVESIRRRR